MTDIECYCCRESELCLDLIDGSLKCLTVKAELASYVAHKPPLEMMYIHGMIPRFLTGPAPSQLSNRPGVLTFWYTHFAILSICNHEYFKDFCAVIIVANY